MTLCQPEIAESQSEPVGDCGAEICLQSGFSNWKYEPTDYCESGVCLQDSLEGLSSLDWAEVSGNRDSLLAADANPFIGITDDEYVRLRELGDDDIDEFVRLLAEVSVSCRLGRFSLELDVPGRDVVQVTFATPLAGEGRSQNFRVVGIDRTYRSLPGGSMGWWIRWISYRFPGIDRIDGRPTGFANYETGLFVARLLLLDQSFEFGPEEDYGAHPECQGR